MEKKKRIVSKVLIAILALLIGVVAGAGGFYLISLAPRTNLEEKIAAKDTVITELNGQLDSLKAALEYVEEETKGNEKILSVLIDTTFVDKVVTLGKEVGGKWQVHSADDVYFLGGDLVFLRIDDGHVPAVALLRIPDAKNFRNWRLLWADYE